jgi:anti-sigma regulatory factor (Ser/Thr protein kinase)
MHCLKLFLTGLFSLVLPVFCTPVAYAQKIPGTPQPSFRNFSIEEGLPSSETYFVHQDKKGYLWVCTDRGVARYNGNRFEVFTTQNGLVDNVVFRIYEDPKGRIWFVAKGLKLCYFYQGKFQPYKYNHVIESLWPSFFHPAKSIAVDQQDNLYFSSQHLGAVKIDKYGHLQPIEDRMHVISYQQIGSSLFWSSKSKYWRRKSSQRKTMTTIPQYAEIFKLSGNKHEYVDKGMLSSKLIHVILVKDDELLCCSDKIFSRKYKQCIREEKDMISLMSTGEKIWIGYIKNGVKQFRKHGDKLIEAAHFLQGSSVSSVCSDQEGGYWFSTLENGVYYCPNMAFLNYSKHQGLIDSYVTSIGGVGQTVVAGYMCNNWQELSAPYRVKNTESSRCNTVIGSCGKELYLFGAMGYNLRTPEQVIRTAWMGDCYTDGQTLLLAGGTIVRLHDGDLLDTLYFGGGQQRIMRSVIAAIMIDGHRRIWAGNYFGLFEVVDHKLIGPENKDSLFRSRISDLAYDPRWKNIAATRGKGIFCFEGDHILRTITEKDGLLSNHLNCLLTDEHGGIWAGSSKGLNYLTKGADGKITVRVITTNHGLISNEITSLYKQGRYLWIGTKKGVTRIELTDFQPSRPSGDIVHFAGLATAHRLWTDNQKPFAFSNDEKIITIYYDILNYRMTGERQLAFRLAPTAPWQYSTVPEIALSNLASGNYEVSVKYVNEDGFWSPPKTICAFSIAPPFWATWYFIFGLILFLLIGAFLLFRLRLRQLNNKHQLHKKMNQLEQKALRAQMNPHFIFNALNSIQSFLIYEENDQAEKYLLQFGSLIRETLNNSRESYIPIASEMHILEQYLDLERMRFKQKFVYHIYSQLTPEELRFGVPPMLVQPYVENAVLHGFPRIETGGTIAVHFISLHNNRLTCVVEDNGIGRQASAQQSHAGHKSFGTTITAERLVAFQEKYGDHFSIEIIDKKTDGVAQGTRVILNIPVVTPEELSTPAS